MSSCCHRRGGYRCCCYRRHRHPRGPIRTRSRSPSCGRRSNGPRCHLPGRRRETNKNVAEIKQMQMQFCLCVCVCTRNSLYHTDSDQANHQSNGEGDVNGLHGVGGRDATVSAEAASEMQTENGTRYSTVVAKMWFVYACVCVCSLMHVRKVAQWCYFCCFRVRFVEKGMGISGGKELWHDFANDLIATIT